MMTGRFIRCWARDRDDRRGGGGAGLAPTLPVAINMGLLWPVTILQMLLAHVIGSAVQKVMPDKEAEN